LETVNLQNISLESLIDLRRREMKSGGSSDIVKLRYKFVELLEKQLKALKTLLINGGFKSASLVVVAPIHRSDALPQS
jgi:hypothetical protein